MATGIHRYAYVRDRPDGEVAPGATVTVYRAGTAVLASLFTDQALTAPLANPFVSDANAYYAYFADPAVADLDEQYSGTGITAPFTIPRVLDLDPRVGSTSGSVAVVTADLAQEILDRQAADLVIKQAGVRYPLGGSILQGQQSAVRVDAIDALIITIDGARFAGYVLKVFAMTKTDDAGTTVTPILRNLTTAVDAGTGAASADLAVATQNFVAVIAAGVNQYKLQQLPSDANAFTYLEAYAQLAAA